MSNSGNNPVIQTEHILVIGGTGMLRKASLYFARNTKAVSVISRNRNNQLTSLVNEGQRAGKFINPIEVDYQNTHQLKEKILQASIAYGKISIVVAWFHWVEPAAYQVTVKTIGNGNHYFRCFDIWGFNSGLYRKNPDSIREEYLKNIKNLVYRKIILGFTKENGKSRWLNNDEISKGVIEAVEQNKEMHIIGMLEPLSDKPE